MKLDDDFRNLMETAKKERDVLSLKEMSIAIAMPLGQFGPWPRTFLDWTRMIMTTQTAVGTLEIIAAWGGFAAGMREVIGQKFLESECEWLFWVDSDMTFDKDVVCRMLTHIIKRPYIKVLSGTARMRNGDRTPVLYKKNEAGEIVILNKWSIDKLFKVDLVGGFGMLMHRSVFETIKEPWFTYVPAPFGDGDDISFCRKLGEAGIEIWIDPTAPFGHIVTDILSGGPDRFDTT